MTTPIFWRHCPIRLIYLFSEKFKNPVRSVKVKNVFERKAFKNGKNIELDTKDLPRGTYYLHVTDSKKKGEKVDAIRLILE